MSQVIIAGDTSGTITLQAPAVSGSTVLTLPATTGTVMVSGNMPAFSAYPSLSQSVSNATWTKITYDIEEYDTNNNFASSRFTPTVAGYYQINARVVANGYATNQTILSIYKNGSESKRLNQTPNSTASSVCPMGSALIYMNGSSDYLEIYVNQSSGSSQTFLGSYSAEAYFQGFLARAA
jgi:hypothetical protein